MFWITTLLVLLSDTTKEQQEDRAYILKCLKKIDPKFCDVTPVQNLKINFNTSHAGFVSAEQINMTASSNQQPLSGSVRILTS
jgi:hypothetical protein